MLRHHLLIPIILFGLFYLLLPTKMYYIDGVYYAEHLESYPWYRNAFHPHHLLFLPLMHLIYDLSSMIMSSLRAMPFLQVFSAISGVITLFLFAKLINKLGFGRWSEIFGVILLGSSYTFWHHSTDANIYVFAHMLTMLSLIIVLDESFWESKSLQILSGVLISIAGLMHQISLLLLIPVILHAILNKNKKGYSAALRTCTVVAIIFGVVYPVVFINYRGDTPGTLEYFFRWIGAFGQARHYFANTEEHGNFLNAATRGHVNAFFALKPLERILFEGRTGDTFTSFKLYRFVMYLTVFSVFVHYLIRKELHIKARSKISYILYVFLVYFIATSIFMPENHFYRIFYMPSLIILWISIFSFLPHHYKILIRPLIGVFLVWFFVFNLSRGIIPETKYINNPYLALTSQVDHVLAKENDLILFPSVDRYFTGIYRYFGKGDAIHIQTGKHFIYRDEMFENKSTYEIQTIEMFNDRYERIFMTRAAFEMELDYLVFTPNNYRLPHPRFMIIDRDRLVLVRWHDVYGRHYAEIKLE